MGSSGMSQRETTQAGQAAASTETAGAGRGGGIPAGYLEHYGISSASGAGTAAGLAQMRAGYLDSYGIGGSGAASSGATETAPGTAHAAGSGPRALSEKRATSGGGDSGAQASAHVQGAHADGEEEELEHGGAHGEGGASAATHEHEGAPGESQEAPSTGGGAGQGGPGPRRPRRRGPQRPPAHPAAPATITHETTVRAPDGAANNRTTVGVGERVRFNSDQSGQWTASGAKAGTVTRGTGQHFVWQAPATGGTIQITFQGRRGTSPQSITMNVSPPSGLQFLKFREDGNGAAGTGIVAGGMGVGMWTHVSFLPLSLSFANTQWIEIGESATGITGYFTGFPALVHTPTDHYLPIDEHNGGLDDHASFWGFPAPWTNGSFEWVIPNRYRLNGESSGHLFTTTHQTCRIEGPPHAGRTTVSKGTASAVRSP